MICYQLFLANADYAYVTFGIWSEGWPDMQWQWAAFNGNGSWSADIVLNQIGQTGVYSVVAYAGNDPGALSQVASAAATIDGLITVGDLTYQRIDSASARVYSYTGSNASVTVPQTVEGLTVTEVGPRAFEKNLTLSSVDLPDTITVIGARAFADCSSLSSMN